MSDLFCMFSAVDLLIFFGTLFIFCFLFVEKWSNGMIFF